MSKMAKSNYFSKVTKAFTTTLIIVGFSAMNYVVFVQWRYVQPAYRTPHPEYRRVIPYVFKGVIVYLSRDERLIFEYGFFVGFALVTLGAYWRHRIEGMGRWTFSMREWVVLICFLAASYALAL